MRERRGEHGEEVLWGKEERNRNGTEGWGEMGIGSGNEERGKRKEGEGMREGESGEEIGA